MYNITNIAGSDSNHMSICWLPKGFNKTSVELESGPYTGIMTDTVIKLKLVYLL